jgi:hypothetical protein
LGRLDRTSTQHFFDRCDNFTHVFAAKIDLEGVSKIDLDFIIREGEAPAEQN